MLKFLCPPPSILKLVSVPAKVNKKNFGGMIFLLCTQICIAQWSTLNLTESKFYTQGAAVDDKALFIGGVKPGFAPSNKVEIYDFVSQQWTLKSMQKARALAGVVVADTLVFIAGGLNPQTNTYFTEVEIYDTKNNTWKPVQHLSVGRASVAAVRSGQELWFAGGYVQPTATTYDFFDVIDVYNLQTGIWSVRNLSIPRYCSGAMLGDKIMFAGGHGQDGPLTIVDIFDVPSQQWSTAQLSVPRFNTAITTAGNYLLIAGGNTFTEDALNTVDIWDATTNSWSTAELSAPRALIGAATVCNTAIFAGGGNADWDTKFLTTSSNQVDFFDASSGTWSQGALDQSRVAAFAASTEEYFFMGGGWSPEIEQLLKSVEVYNCMPSGLTDIGFNGGDMVIRENPSSGSLNLRFDGELPTKIVVYNLIGTPVATYGVHSHEMQENLSFLATGTYLIRAVYEHGACLDKKWVKG
jgi:Kelch motif